MTKKMSHPKNDSSDTTVIGFEGADLHHELKDKQSAHADAEHNSGDDAADPQIINAVEEAEDGSAVSAALKDAVKK